jgi:hypothetical protein
LYHWRDHARNPVSHWRFAADGPYGLPVTRKVRLQEKVAAPAGMLALVNAHILPMRGLEQIQDGVILVNGNRIAAVGRMDQTLVPKNVRMIDLQGRIVMPGLIDNHWHGIIHQDGTLPQQSWPLRSPRIFSTGPSIYGAQSDGTQDGEQAFIETLDDARREVRRRQAWGAIAVKSYLLPRREQRQYVVAAAREAGMFVASESAMAHIPAVSQIMDGETSIEHAISLPNIYQDILQLWRQSSVDTPFCRSMFRQSCYAPWEHVTLGYSRLTRQPWATRGPGFALGNVADGRRWRQRA